MTSNGKAYRRAYAALAETFQLDTALLRLEAGRVAALRVQMETTILTLAEAQRARRDGKGRRPNLREIERLSRRAGFADGTYTLALDRLRQPRWRP